MTVFFTKVWGFGVPVGPLQFSTEGWRDRAREVLKDGDLVVLVGTKGEPTAESNRGLLLGILEPTREPVLSLDFIQDTKPEHYDENNKYRWPFGLLNLNAWRLLERPSLEDISSRDFYMESALGIVPFTEAEAEKILRLSREKVPLLEPVVRARARIESLETIRRRTAPPPSFTRKSVMQMRSAPAYTYAMEIVGAGTTSYKVGWAFDYRIRARHFNQSSMPQLGGLKYKPVLNHLWDTARQAFHMEQRLLTAFEQNRHSANHEIVSGISYDELLGAWLKFIRE